MLLQATAHTASQSAALQQIVLIVAILAIVIGGLFAIKQIIKWIGRYWFNNKL